MFNTRVFRYYLSFDDELLDLLRSWGMAMQGLDALREGFCSRRLVENFGVVWLTVLLLSTLLDSWLTPVSEYIRSVAVLKFRAGVVYTTNISNTVSKNAKTLMSIESEDEVEQEDLFAEACLEAEDIQQEVVQILSTLIMCIVFGNRLSVCSAGILTFGALL